MKVLRDHFGGKVTIFVNGRIINGCQNFTLEEAESVFEEYKVPEKYRKDVYDNYVETSKEEDILSFVNDEDWMVRASLASLGYGLDVLIDDENWCVRLNAWCMLNTV